MRTDEDRVGDSAPPGESWAQLQARHALLCLVPVLIVVVLLFCILGLANSQGWPRGFFIALKWFMLS